MSEGKPRPRESWVNPSTPATLRRAQAPIQARCQSCEWGCSGENLTWPALRARAHRHVASTGHTVRAERVEVYTYGRP